jgi:small conductance mechanosensitive channel
MSLFQSPTSQTAPSGFDLSIIIKTISDITGWFLARVPYLIIGAIVFVIFMVAARIVKRILLTAGERTRLDVTLADLLGRLVSFVITLLGLFVAAVIIFPTFKPGDLITGLGITSVAIGFAFKDVLQNFFAGILLLWRRPFVVGDQIRAKDYEGTVEEITVRSTRLRTADGERAVIPNGEVYTSGILVRTAYDQRRLRFTVGVGYTDSIEEARETIRGVLERTEGVLKEPEPGVFVAELAASSVNFDVYFWIESRDTNVLKVKDAVATGIKLALDEAGIDMPYPHTVLLFHDATGTREGDIKRAEYLTSRRNGREHSKPQISEAEAGRTA